MPTPCPLFQDVCHKLRTLTADHRPRSTSIIRLALLVTGLIAAKSCILTQVATELDGLELTAASTVESIERRLRRTLVDPLLDPSRCYRPLLPRVIVWSQAGTHSRVFLIVDESTKRDQLHLLQVGIACWGGCIPVAWQLWEQNVALPDGRYWESMDRVLEQAAQVLPPNAEVIVLADRAYDVPAFIDRIAAYGWHWIVRCKDQSKIRFQDRAGHDWSLADLIRRHVARPGRRWATRGRVFKNAGWRTASVVSLWAAGQKAPLTVLTDLPPRWKVLQWYRRRFWIEPGFRNLKRRGWQWEECQVQGVAHHQALLTAMAWATVIALCAGIAQAQERLAQVPRRTIRKGKGPGKPQAARQSVFTMGLSAARRWLRRRVRTAFPWTVPDLDGPSWNDRWRCAQAKRCIFQSVRS